MQKLKKKHIYLIIFIFGLIILSLFFSSIFDLSSFLTSFFIFGVLFFFYKLSISGKKYKSEFNSYFEKEKKAQSNVKKEFPELKYIKPDYNAFPFEEKEEEISKEYRKQEIVKEMIDLPMINLSNISNRNLKLRFGSNYLNKLTEYEQNYYSFLHQLHDWVKLLIKEDKRDKAIKVLEEAIILKSDISYTYIALAKLYLETEQLESYKGLCEYIRSNDSLNSDYIFKKIRNKKETSN